MNASLARKPVSSHQGDDNLFLGQDYCAHLMCVAKAICLMQVSIRGDAVM